jgi:Dyp-type peroxidase family
VKKSRSKPAQRKDSIDLSGLQANILKGHSRRSGIYLFLRFLDRGKALRALAEIRKDYITSAARQQADSDEFKKKKASKGGATTSPNLLGTFGLSWSGYQFLGLGDYGPRMDDARDLRWFQSGLKAFPENLAYRLHWNPDVEHWDAAYRDNDTHAVMILAHDDPKSLADAARSLKQKLGDAAQVIAEEHGSRDIVEKQKESMDHFGFRDGITNSPDPSTALVPEAKLPGESREGLGSFLAVLKFEQNPYKFQRAAEELAEKINQTCGLDVSPEDAATLAIGRRQDGTPLVHDPVTGSTGGKSRGLTDFDYSGDEQGLRCPHQAHIRKMNRRTKEGEWSANIVRRGLAYGRQREDLNGDFDQTAPSGGVGLLFTSYQDNLLRVITLLHKANDPEQLDATIGRTNADSQAKPQTWLTGGCQLQHLMADFVTLRGGGYFFAPSMTLLEKIDRLSSRKG